MYTINRILDLLLTISAIVVIPCKFVTTFVLGFLGSIPIVGIVVLLLISVIWAVFYGILTTLGKLIDACPAILGIPIGLIGLPIAFVGSVFVNLMPGMGDAKGKAVKQMTIDSWPFTTSFSRFMATGILADGSFSDVLQSFSKVPLYRMVLQEHMAA